jgi:hypothetical protein
MDSKWKKYNGPARYNITACVCPKCRLHHTQRMFWSGRGTPRKYCDSCREKTGDIERLDIQSVPVPV